MRRVKQGGGGLPKLFVLLELRLRFEKVLQETDDEDARKGLRKIIELIREEEAKPELPYPRRSQSGSSAELRQFDSLRTAEACGSLTFRNGVVIEDCLGDALRFVAEDGSYRAYDLAPVVVDDLLTETDVRTANRIVARMGQREIDLVMGRSAAINAKLAMVPRVADLCEPAERVPWSALMELIGAFEGLPGLGLPRITKILHKKRPSLIPILDDVVQKYLVSIDGEMPASPLAARAVALTHSYKRELDSQHATLACVKEALASRGIALSICRLLDLYIWAYSGQYEPLFRRQRSGPQRPEPASSMPRPSLTDPAPSKDHEYFVDRDADYLAWIRSHATGFVLNCARHPRPDYLVLHRAACWTINPQSTRNVRWTNEYIKICSTTVDALVAWAQASTGEAPTSCKICLA